MKYVTDETIGEGLLIAGGKLTVPIDDKTIKVVEGKLTAVAAVQPLEGIRIFNATGETELAVVAEKP